MAENRFDQAARDDGIIQQWLAIAGAEPDRKLRGDYGGLALVYSELIRAADRWERALKGWNMVESKHVLEWMNQGRQEGRQEGRLETLRNTLRILLEDNLGPVPAAVQQRIDGCTNPVQLQAAVRQAPRLAKFDDLQL